MVLDYKFNEFRLINGPGFLVARVNDSGAYSIQFTEAPVVDLESYQAISLTAFGKLVIQQSDGILRNMIAPAAADLYLGTDGSGNVVFRPIPTATVPDPLSVTTANITNLTITNGIVNGGLLFTGLATGTLTSILGVDATGNLIKGTAADTSVQSVMFFESPTSPSAATPNGTTTAGSMLVIGNEIVSSLTPGALISVTNSQTLAIVQEGFYEFEFSGQVVMNANTAGTPEIDLLINGVNVGRGNSRAGVAGGPIRGSITISGLGERRMNVGDTIQLQLAAGSGTNISAYEVRLRARRIGA